MVVTQTLHRGITWLFMMLACMFAPPLHAQSSEAGIRLNTSDPEVYIGDSIIIDIEAVGLIDALDISLLSVNADLLRETIGTRIAVVEGQVVDIHTRRMEFLPRTEGLATFGPLLGVTSRGPVRSNVLQVNVQPPNDTQWEPGPDDARIDVRVSSARPWVGQELTLDIELRHRYLITEETIDLPPLDEFDALPVFESRRTVENTDTDSAPVRVIAWRYLLWPRQSGDVQIDPAYWRGTMVRSRTSRSPIDLESTALPLNVRPRPADITGWWLPARQLSLSDRWSRDPRELTAGEEIERTLVLEADGVLASQLPVVEPLASRSMSSVSLGQTREHRLIDGRVRATAEYRFRMTARSPVPVFLDTVRVAWWDTEEDKAAEAIVPARRVNIGLPDRADLLADIAMEQSLWIRLQVLMASVKLPAAVGAITAGILAIGLLLALLLPWPSWRTRGRQIRYRLPPM